MHVHRLPEPVWPEGIRARDDRVGGADVVIDTDEYGLMDPADAEFIAAARTAVPALLDALDEMADRLEELHLTRREAQVLVVEQSHGWDRAITEAVHTIRGDQE